MQFTPLQQSIFAAPLIVLPATPANGYGLAHSMVAILLVTCGLRSDRPGLVGIGLASALATVLWKAQLGINVSLALALLSLPYARRLLRPSAVVPPLAMLIGIVALSRLFFDSSRTPTAFIDKSLGEDLATWHLSMLPQTSLITRLEPWIHGATIDAFFARILLNALASFGILIILWLIVAASSLVRHRRLQLPMVVTGCSVAVFLSLGALLAENRTGFRFEMQFSPYLLPLLLLEITMLSACAQLLGIVRRKPVPLVWGFVCTIPLLLISTVLPQDRTLGMPFPKALADCTAYLRTHAGPFDVVQDSASDPSGLMSGMTERRTYVGILAFQRFVGMTDIVKSYNDRVAANEKLLHAGSVDELKSLAKETGIRWYVLWPDAEVGWPVDVLSSPVFRSGDFRVYDLNQLDATKP